VSSVQIAAYQAGMDARFRVAARHSRLVRALRIAVPLAVLLAMTVIVAISVFNPFRFLGKLPLDMGNLVVSGTKVTMEAPHLSGFTPDQRPYELWAKTATQDLTDPDHLELNTVHARMLMEDQSTVTVDARSGLFSTKAQQLDLKQDIYLQTSTGTQAWMTQAAVDMAAGNVASDEPVDVKMVDGSTVRGQRMRITEHGGLIRFEGGVVVNMSSEKPEPVAAEPSAPVAAPTAKAEPARPRAAAGKSGTAK
jgi:lipopolysaccharide export system protein LptC